MTKESEKLAVLDNKINMFTDEVRDNIKEIKDNVKEISININKIPEMYATKKEVESLKVIFQVSETNNTNKTTVWIQTWGAIVVAIIGFAGALLFR